MTNTADEITQEAWERGGQDPLPPAKHRIDLTHEDTAALAISDAITDQVIPDLYVRSGDICQVAEINDGTGPRLVIRTVGPDSLRMLLAQHTTCFSLKATRGGILEPVTGLPAVATAKAVLSQDDWPGVAALAGVVAMPVFRPDGTVLSAPGYDAVTRLYHRPAFAVDPIVDPSAEEVGWAKKYVLDYVLADFCWDSDASRANYLALLMTPLLRLYIGGLPPLGVISATTRGSGKTLLTEILEAVYGLSLKPWAKRDEEITKVITATLKSDTEPVICFDNVGPFDTVDHASLAALLTKGTWSDRILGSTANFSGPNDRLWLVTGNNVALGGDIASRSILVRLDPKVERPEERTGFAIDDMWSWLRSDHNRGQLLYALLVLARSWIRAGGLRDRTIRMRNFSAWGQAMGGLLAFHEVKGFVENKAELETADDEETSTVAFLAKWHERYRQGRQRASGLVASARAEFVSSDPWSDTFPTRPDGKPFTAKGLARFLGARRGRIFGGLVLIGEYDEHAKVWWYSVRPVDEGQQQELETGS